MKLAEPLAEDLRFLEAQQLDYTRDQILFANLYELMDPF